MRLTRRSLLSVVAAASVAPGLARAQSDRLTGERSVGKPDAPVTVIEYFSMTCTHCAAFSRDTMPSVRSQFIEPGKVRFIYRDFPLDQLALTAAMVARSLPPDRYEAFVSALLASQDRWAFGRGANATEELWKMAALAGMSREGFNSAINDNALKTFILKEQDAGAKKWGIESTPTFIINGQKTAGAVGFDAFKKLLTDAGA
jgi:protein-disulfide isomerase